MEARLALPLTLLYSALPASAQTEPPAEMMESLRKAGPYAVEAWRELRPVIWSPGDWLLKNPWLLAILLSFLVWAVAGRIAWAAIKGFIIAPAGKWLSEGSGKELIDAAKRASDRLSAWSAAELNGPVGERMLQLGGGMLISPFALVLAREQFTGGANQLGCFEAFFTYGFGVAAVIFGLGVIAWVFLEVGSDAYKSINFMRRPGGSVEYPYSIRVIFLGLGSGILGLAVGYAGRMIVEFGGAQLKDMQVLAGAAATAIGGLITLFSLGPLLFSFVTLAGPILHAVTVLVMWPFVIASRKA